jgi:hypothetical protein
MAAHACARHVRREWWVLGSCAPTKADRWGPGSRVPALIVSPLAKDGYVDPTQYDTTSVLHFITRRFDLPVLPRLVAGDTALDANGHPDMGADRCADVLTRWSPRITGSIPYPIVFAAVIWWSVLGTAVVALMCAATGLL